MTGPRRLSQAISEGDGISVLVEVADGDGARQAEAQGAEGLVLAGPADAVRDATQLPVLVRAGDVDAVGDAGLDAVLLRAADGEEHEELLEQAMQRAAGMGLECVVQVADEEELAWALERLDPEILLLAPEAEDDESPLELLLELLPDVPAGKLAIAELVHASREEIEELERAGVDAVVVRAADVAPLVGEQPPEV